jgi:hypothetical protein
MRKLLFFVLAGIVISCGAVDGDNNQSSQLTVFNNANSDFTLTEISFVGYNFSDLNILFGQSQTFSLDDGFVGGTSNININVNFRCGPNGWAMSDSVNFNEGSETLVEFIQCSEGGSGYCREVCLD